MTQHQKILNIIGLIRDSSSQMEQIYLYGSCMNFYCILHAIFPQAKAFYNQNHVVTEIDGRYYDITGSINRKEFESEGYMPFARIYSRKKRTNRAFSQMYFYKPK